MKDTLGILLAGGAGERLYPLTRDRAKPAVTFGGIYRIIDITLSNCVNSGLRRVYILTQYKALSLNRQIREGWNIFGREIGEFIEILPPMKRVSENWYMGTADAVYQNIYSIGSEQPKYVIILSGDHIYKMNYERMLKQHQDAGADVTVATLTTDPEPTAVILAWSISIVTIALPASSKSRSRPNCARPTIRPKSQPRWASTSSTPMF
jgi:glucose-1-phosphate adenylyltransferase